MGPHDRRIRQIEERAMIAWPSLETVAYDGWVLRFSCGYTRRANSVHPIERGTRDLAAKIAEAERMYRERGLPTIFKMTEASEPKGLEHALAVRGYHMEARTSVRTADVASLRCGSTGGVEIETAWGRAGAWRETVHDIVGIAPENRHTHDQIVGAIGATTGFAVVKEAGRIVGCGLGVVEETWVGVFDVAVASASRRRGNGERLMAGLLRWAQRQGACRAYLQVMADNAPALALYSKLGFGEAYEYWYRVQR